QSFRCRRSNKFPRTLEIPEHLRIRNTQHKVAARREPRVASQVVFLSCREVVSFAVNLNHQMRSMADEIGNVGTHRHLATKSEAVEVMRLEIAPEQPLGARHRLAKAFRALPLLVAYEKTRQFPPP